MNEPPAARLMPGKTGARRLCGERLRYAGFWIRVGALAGDGFALFIPTLLIIVLSTISRSIAMALVLPNALMFWIYALCFHATTGQTLGKRAFGLRVVRPDGSRIGWTDSFWRGAVDLFFALVWGAERLLGLNALTPAEYAGSGWLRLAPASSIDASLIATLLHLDGHLHQPLGHRRNHRHAGQPGTPHPP